MNLLIPNLYLYIYVYYVYSHLIQLEDQGSKIIAWWKYEAITTSREQKRTSRIIFDISFN